MNIVSGLGDLFFRQCEVTSFRSSYYFQIYGISDERSWDLMNLLYLLENLYRDKD